MDYGTLTGRGARPALGPPAAGAGADWPGTVPDEAWTIPQAQESRDGAPAPAGAPAAREHMPVRAASHGEGRSLWRRVPASWPLLPVLVVQALLSLRLVRADTAFQDEAQFLWAGHLQWAHWLHGTPIPPFPSYFSGSPVIYPPIGALADSAGGLAGARILSLIFMLGATVLLWNTAARLFGRRAAFFAAALFATLGPTLHLGTFATFDALSVLLVGLATWCVVRAGERGRGTGWMIASGAALAVANAAAYTSILFDLIVLLFALLTALPRPGGKFAASRCLALAGTVVVLLAAGLLAGGSAYLGGFQRTTLAAVASTSPLSVLAHSSSWAGLIVILAVCGVVISWAGGRGPTRTLLLAVLAAAAVVGPLVQARLHTLASLNEHVGLGAWFAAIAAGLTVDRFIAAAPAGRMRALTLGACIVALVFPLSLGAGQSRALATSWPNASSFIAILRPLAEHGNGRLLIEDASIARYYLPSGSQWQRWSSTRNIITPSGAYAGGPRSSESVMGAGNVGVFAEYITHGYFSYIALNFADTTALDHRLADQLHRDPHYRIIDVVPYGIEVPPLGQGTYVIWRYEPGK